VWHAVIVKGIITQRWVRKMAVKNQPSTTPFGVDNGLYIFCQTNNAFTPTLQLKGLPGTATEQAAGQKN